MAVCIVFPNHFPLREAAREYLFQLHYGLHSSRMLWFLIGLAVDVYFCILKIWCWTYKHLNE